MAVLVVPQSRVSVSIQLDARIMQSGFDKQSTDAHCRLIEALWETVYSIAFDGLADVIWAEVVAERVLARIWHTIRGVDLDTCSFVAWLRQEVVEFATRVRRCHSVYERGPTVVLSYYAVDFTVIDILPGPLFWADLVEVLSDSERLVLVLMRELGLSIPETAREMARSSDEVIALAESASRKASRLADHSGASSSCECGGATLMDAV